ncbi:histidine kinase N-terminal 7TM domain-containing protein [Halobacterium zhouii]|uniref:histidine kinase N-terminal 7TM domain-containing protein n=1 Tax=Halobacterium zhouii TaxID=2902624 RepID=UPI001E320B80|nr:histidine kinase N-terminal 7TM domain-containing protein [Halobacterium zhouii]
MALQATPYTLPLVVCGFAFAVFAVHLARQWNEQSRDVQYAIPLLLATAVWMLGYAAELSVTTTDAQLLFAKIEYAGNVTAPLLWFTFVLSYLGYDDLLDRRWRLALAVPPVVTYALVVTYPATTLVWTSTETISKGGFVALHTGHGPVFYAFMVYIYALVAVSMWLLARRLAAGASIYRRQTTGLLVGAFVPAVAGLVYISGANPFPAVNLPALAFIVTAGAVAWSVARNELFRLAPVAWETVVQEFDSAVFVLDDADRVVTANPAGRELAAAAVGAHAGEALTPALGGDCWRRSGQHECDAFRDGERHVFEVSVASVERGTSRLGRTVTVRDVTERHAREQRLEEFANVVSHDLRNPLNVAKGNLELGRERGDDDHFEETADALDRMERIIDDLLTLAREERAERDHATVSLAATARTAWQLVDATDANGTLEVGGDRELAADETALLRLLENLFRNAVEHGSASPALQARQDAVEHGSPDGLTASDDVAADGSHSAVAVRVGATEDGFFVADDGPGIPMDEREQVFDRGYTTNDEGTGFGLAIVEQIAGAHDWTVALAESEDGGARFEFTVE